MDTIYTESCLKDFLNKVYLSNLDNKQINDFLSKIITEQKNNFKNIQNNYLLILIIICINKNNLTYQNQMLINEIIHSLLLDQLEENYSLKEKVKEIPSNKKISLDTLDLTDNEAVKAYFLQENPYLESNGNFAYPEEGKNAVIVSGDNMTIPGVRYMINYIIDHTGKVVGIQGYPRRELSQANYEEVYSDLINSIFKDDEEK